MRALVRIYGGKRPAYAVLAGIIRDRIASGEYQPGDRLPSAADLSREYDVSIEVSRRALRALKDEGLTDAFHGRGTRVREQPGVEIREPDPAPRDVEVVERVTARMPTADEADALEIGAAVPVLVIVREQNGTAGDPLIIAADRVELRYRLPRS